ncbi:uracil-xanthine permease family protein [Candidatus Izemoplasma sp. B36]|uniref:uracil-xanthine permease family protein n=1 Tax=Candidatus Izemoplasma sp. B36 TaxID=3242468 RepID=UPI003558CD69
MNEKMILGIKDKPKTSKWFALSFQHVFAMFGATILVPYLTGLPISVALFASGVGTLIYILCTNAKVPVYLGSSFAYIVVIQAVSGFDPNTPGSVGNYGAALTGLFVVGVVYLIISLIIKVAGKGWIEKALPPIVIGPMIMIIGLGLSSVAIGNAGLSGGSWKQILTAVVSLGIVIFIALKGKKFVKIIPFLVGIFGGFIFASIIGLVDFTNFVSVITSPGDWFKIPEFMFLGWKDGSANVLGTEITFYQMNFTAVLTIAPLAFVTAAEHIGDHAVLSKIVGKDFLHDPGLDKTIMGDGIATAFAALIGGPANTTYGENTSVVGMTKVASVWVTGGAAVIAIVLSFFNVFTSLIAAIPASVMGGISIILYGFIASNGLKVLLDNKINMGELRNLIIVASMLVIGLGGSIITFGSFQVYGMSLAAIVGIVLNFVLPKGKKPTLE